MKYRFCTLFDKNYLFKGLALYNSLQQHCAEFTLWILCMDDVAYSTLQKLNLPNVELISLAEFEDEELLVAKASRTPVEYCWTCTPSLPLYILNKYPDLEMITYLDADLLFYSDPGPIYDEMGDRSIMIIEHRFPPHLKFMAETAGIYNVEMLTFRNDTKGRICLSWWRDRCNEWCFFRYEDGKMGDQKYLDDWTERFEGVHVLQHKGAGLAPWNLERYSVTRSNDATYVDEDRLIFYHFHQFELLSGGRFKLASPFYKFRKSDINLIYKPYIRGVKEAMAKVRKVNPKFEYGITKITRRERLEDFYRNKKSRVGALVRSFAHRDNIQKLSGSKND